MKRSDPEWTIECETHEMTISRNYRDAQSKKKPKITNLKRRTNRSRSSRPKFKKGIENVDVRFLQDEESQKSIPILLKKAKSTFELELCVIHPKRLRHKEVPRGSKRTYHACCSSRHSQVPCSQKKNSIQYEFAQLPKFIMLWII